MAHVVADSSSSSVADQLSVRLGQEYRVKLGRSFTFPEQNSFHTIKYDFKPQSVDSTQPGHLKVTDDEVNVSLPVVSQGDSVEDYTHFRGNKKPCTKECILIINTQTGEAVLEKISNNVNLKAVRDGRKPAAAAVNRDRSVSPSPFLMQSKGHSASKSQLSTSSGHRHLTPSPILTATPTTTNNSIPSAAKGGGASSSNATPGSSSSKKGQKRQTKSKTPKTPKTPAIVPTSATKQESKGKNGSKPKAKKKNESSTKQASIPAAPKIKTEPAIVTPQASSSSQATAMLSMPLPGMGMELTTQEISPIHSNNPPPEPIRPPSWKKQKLTRNSSSSSSDSSDSDSEGEEPMSQAPPIQQAPPQFSSISVTRVTNTQPQISSSNMPVFSHSQPIAQKGHIAQKSQPGQPSQPKIPPHPDQRLSSASSSGSDSDSSSGSSSSDSSSDSSDEENDKEVAAISRGPVVQEQRSLHRSYSELKSDLHLSSDSGSSSD